MIKNPTSGYCFSPLFTIKLFILNQSNFQKMSLNMKLLAKQNINKSITSSNLDRNLHNFHDA